MERPATRIASAWAVVPELETFSLAMADDRDDRSTWVPAKAFVAVDRALSIDDRIEMVPNGVVPG